MRLKKQLTPMKAILVVVEAAVVAAVGDVVTETIVVAKPLLVLKHLPRDVQLVTLMKKLTTKRGRMRNLTLLTSVTKL